jgi:fimbrial isopeptide formation D2 family protein
MNAGTYCFNVSYSATGGGNYVSVSQQDDVECFTVGAATPVLDTQMTTPSQTTVGNSWDDAATVTGNTTGGAPTGSVSFNLCKEATPGTPCTTGGTHIDTLTAPTGTSGDVSTYALPSSDAQTPTVGGYCFLVSYSATPGGNYNSVSAQDDTECFTVTPATPALFTNEVTPTNTAVGNSWNDSATVTGNTTGGAPTGSVAFSFCKETTPGTPCTGGTVVDTLTTPTGTSGDISTYTLPNSDAETPGNVGTYCFNVAYSATGGGNYVSVEHQSDVECFTVTPAPSTTVTQQSTSDSGSGSINLGGTITDTATVTGNPTGGAPTGSVTFTVCGPTSSEAACSDGSNVGTEPTALTKGSGDTSTATSPGFTPTAVGTYCFAAVYDPASDANYVTSNDNVSGDVQATECFLVTQPDFKIVKTDVPGDGKPVAPGTTVPYTVTISNIGDGPGTVTVTDTLPSNLTIVNPPPVCSVTGCVVTNTTGSTWTFTMDLAASGSAGDTGTVTFSAMVSASDTADVVNTATITSGNCDNGQAPADRSHAAVNNCSSTVTNPVPDFTVTKTDGPGNNTPVSAGSTIPYTVAIKNVGGGAGSAVITDPLPSQVTAQGTPSCSVPSGDSCTATLSGSTLTVNVTLAAGDTATVTFSAVVGASATGTVANTATITTGPCNTSAGCASTVSNPIIVVTPATTPPPVVKPAVIAFTGADIAAMVASALALLGLGGFLVLISRRRRQAGDSG